MKIYKYYRDHRDGAVVLRAFEVLKQTPKGYWFKDMGGFRRWTSAVARVRYAYPTQEEAAVAFGVPIVAKNQLKMDL